MAAKKRGNCKKFGRVKTGPRKGLCRKGPAHKKSTRCAKKKGASRRRANCEKWGYSALLGRCRKGPGRSGGAGSRTAAGASSIFGPYAEGYRMPSGADAYVGASSHRMPPSEESEQARFNGLGGYRRR